MADNPLISLTNLSSPYGGNLAQIQRQQRLADMLQQQGSEAPQQFSYNGITAVTPPTAYLAKLVDKLAAVYSQNKASEAQNSLGQKIQGDAADWIGKLTAPQSMSPAQPGVSEAIPGAPTVAPSPGQMSAGGMTPQARTALLLQGMQNPMTASAAGTMMSNESELARQKELQQGQFGQQKSMQAQSEAFQAAQADLSRAQQAAMQNNSFENQQKLQQAQQAFQAAQTQGSQEFQRSMGTPMQIADPTSPTGFRFVRPEQAVGQPGYNANAMFGPMGLMGGGNVPSAAPQAPPADAAPGGPVPAQTPSQGTPMVPGQQGQSAPATSSPLTGDAFLKTLPPAAQETVKGLAEGRIPVSPQMVRTPQGMQILAAASQYDPTFDASNYAARAAQRKNYEGGGKQYQELQAIGTVAGHLHDLAKTADQLNNNSYPWLNMAGNAVGQAIGKPAVNQFNTVKQAVSNELSKAYRAGAVTEGDVREWQSNLNSSNSPEQFRAVIGQLNDLLASKRTTLEEGFRQTMGKTAPPQDFSATNERTKAIFDNISAWSKGGKGAASPGGWSVNEVK